MESVTSYPFSLPSDSSPLKDFWSSREDWFIFLPHLTNTPPSNDASLSSAGMGRQAINFWTAEFSN